MKRHLRIAVAALLVLACVGVLLGFAACKDEKQASTITAELEQSFVYDGQVHNVVATLNHEEAQLQYDPQQGFTDIGTYTVTITAPETDNYYAPTPVTVTVHILDPAAIAADELADKILAGVSDFNVGDPLGVDLGVDLSYKPATGEGWGYKLGVKGTLDLENMDNTAFSIALTDTLADEQLFALTFVGGDGAVYLNAGGGKYTIQLSELLDALGITAPADTNVTMGTYLSMIIGVLGTNCTASADGNTYTMDFNLKVTLGGALGGIVGSILPENIANAIYSIFGASDWNGFVNALPELSGKIEVKFADNKLIAVSLKDVAYKQGETTATVQANVTPFTISNTPVEVTAPADKDTYEAVELLNFTLNGNIALTTDGVNYVDYDVLVQSDLSLKAILAGDWEHIGKAYIRLSHICTDDCGSYCSEKYEAGEGSILEVGYDSSINPTSAYIVAGMRNLLGTKAMTAIAGSIGALASDAIPEYTAITADLPGLVAQAVGFPATGETPSDPGTGDTGSSIDLGAILGAVNIGENASGNLEIKIDIASLMTTLGVDEGTMSTIGAIFGDPDKEFAMDGAAISVSGLRFFRTEVAGGDDMLNTLTKVKDITVEGDKVFTSAGILGMGESPGLAESAKTWEIVNLSDSNVPDMYTDLDLSMLTVYEAQTQLIGNEVFFNVTTLDGQTRENVPAKIWGVSGIDWNLIGQPQEAQLLVSVPQTIVNGTVTDALAATINVYELFKTSVPVTITLAEASNFELVMGENFGDGNYDLLETLPADFATATVTYTKTAGDKTAQGSVTVNPVNDYSKYLWTPYATSVASIHYVTVNGVGIEKNVPMAINPGTVTLEYEAYGQTFTKDITISDPYTEKTMTMAKNTATVRSIISSNDLTFTLNKADGTDTVVIKASSRYINTAGILSFPEGMTVSDGSDTDVTTNNTYWRYNTFPGTIDQESITTEVYFDIFGKHFVNEMTLNNAKTTYKVTADTPVVNGLTATVKLTITNNVVGFGTGFEGTIGMRKSYGGDLELADVSFSADPATFTVANDLGGNDITVTVTITATKAGTGKFYIDLMNGETKVASSSTVTIEFTDPAAEA